MQILETQGTLDVKVYLDDINNLDGSLPNTYLLGPIHNSLLCEIKFQNGPIKEVGVNGVQIEDILVVLIDRLNYFQSSPYSCKENEAALMYLDLAARQLASRTETKKI